MEAEKLLELVSSVVFADIPMQDLRLRQRCRLAEITFVLADVKKVSHKKRQILIPRLKAVQPPERTVQEAMTVLVCILFPKFSRFQAEKLGLSWLHEPLEVRCCSK